ncbi:hypothetical protein BEWA_002550 [Theileria equi strain WA]|uniref:CS domain-containing protein n=1 Tax=Theileria equi strain WA TaxID=1537102 RepID=L0B017_THEEQ|nr:hypothetical protein BEWA_002550 [Theileria equi strain WA]AFZ80848.1 hypothetical protein BEWA_002550 [Theileria equi strain WA]|eukprot:XP_004830514.1 hypothetical protein BEWA_002550 [Theileria equi strain WA]
MTIDYSKWDKLEVSEDEADYTPKVLKVNKDQQIVLGGNGYSIQTTPRPSEPKDVSSIWSKRLDNGAVFLNSHIYAQNRHEVTAFIAVEGSNLNVDIGEKDIKIYSKGDLVFSRELYAKVRDGEEFWNWEITRLEVDWDELDTFSESLRNGTSTRLEFKNPKIEQFVEVNLQKLNEIQDCVIWWPKLFKDDEKEIIVNRNESNFKQAWEKAHEMFKKRVGSFEKIEI